MLRSHSSYGYSEGANVVRKQVKRARDVNFYPKLAHISLHYGNHQMSEIYICTLILSLNFHLKYKKKIKGKKNGSVKVYDLTLRKQKQFVKIN